MARILGLDISSSCIGYAVLDCDINTQSIKIVDYDYYLPPKKGSILERLNKTQQDIKSIIKGIQPDYIAIEDIIQFLGGGSTAKTIIALASFNRAIGLVAYEYLGQAPELYSVMTIRHGIKLTKELPKKEQIPQILEKRFNIQFDYLYNKDDEIDKKSFDMADACAVGAYHSLILTKQIIRKVKKKKSKSKKTKKSK